MYINVVSSYLVTSVCNSMHTIFNLASFNMYYLFCWSTAEKYCSLVEEEGGLELLKALLASPIPYQRIKALARVVITQCEHFKVCVSLATFPSLFFYFSDSYSSCTVL